MVRPALHGALLLLVLLAGCTGFLDDPPERDERAVAALADAKSAIDAVETYRYGTYLHVEASGDGRTKRFGVRVSGAVDVAAKRLNSTSEVDGRTRQAYLVDRTAYRQCPNVGSFWGVQNETAEDWDALTPAYRQLSLLERGDLRYAGGATVDGRDVTHLVGEPTADALQQYSEDRNRPVFGGPEIHAVRMEVYIDNETDLPLRSRLRFQVTEGDGSATARLATRFGHYGEPVTIEVPEEALENQLELGCAGS